jgi:hypothetical protein
VLCWELENEQVHKGNQSKNTLTAALLARKVIIAAVAFSSDRRNKSGNSKDGCEFEVHVVDWKLDCLLMGFSISQMFNFYRFSRPLLDAMNAK